MSCRSIRIVNPEAIHFDLMSVMWLGPVLFGIFVASHFRQVPIVTSAMAEYGLSNVPGTASRSLRGIQPGAGGIQLAWES